MQRGRALLAAGAVLLAARLVPATADTAPTTPPDPCTSSTAAVQATCEMPRGACPTMLSDPANDASPQYPGAGQFFASKADLDILGVDLRLTPDYLESFLEIDQLNGPNAMQPYEATYRYIVTFKIGSKLITATAEQLNPNGVGSKAYPTGDGPTRYPTVAINTTEVGATSTFVLGTLPTPSWVIVSFPRSQLEKYLGAPIDPTTVFTDVQAKTYVEFSAEQTAADTTTQTGTAAQINPFDDSCYGFIKPVTVPRVAYQHTGALSATLLGNDSKPNANQTLTFTIQDGIPTTLTATTDANGIASVNYGPVGLSAGTYPVTVSFAGDKKGNSPVTVTNTLTVVAANTSLTALKVTKPTATTRTVTTTLLDDSHKGIAGAHVDWYVNGKKVATVTTDKNGSAVFKTGKPGQSVQARYAGLAGKLLASASTTAKL